MISSSENPALKKIRFLLTKKGRVRENMFVIEGPHIVLAALESDFKIEYSVLSSKFTGNRHFNDITACFKSKNIKYYEADEKILSKISETENSQGIFAVVKPKEYDFLKSISSVNGLILICDNIKDPGNLGTILRICDAAKVNAVILSKGTVDIYNQKVVRSSMGSIFNTAFFYADDLIELINNIKKSGFQIISTASLAKTNIYQLDLKKKTAVIIGSEESGIQDEIIGLSDVVASIPIIGKAESLNAAVSSAVILYEAVRQRNFCNA